MGVLRQTDVSGHAMVTVRNQTDRQKMNRTLISDKPCLPSFAKAKEKQCRAQVNASCFTFAFAQPHKDLYIEL